MRTYIRTHYEYDFAHCKAILRRASGFVAIEVFRIKNVNSLVELTEKKLIDAKAISRFVAGIDFDTVFMRHQIYLMLLAIDGHIENIHTSVRCVHNMRILSFRLVD